MAKNIQVNLTFKADTSAAKKEMANLQQALSNLTSTPITSVRTQKMQEELQGAVNKAVELKIALDNATNVDTGKLNFSKFDQELKRNKMTIQQYGQALAKLGPQGVEAFAQLARAIQQSETPLIQLQGKFKKFADTMANTIRWQISSSITNNMMSAFKGTIDYAYELNESLNNIRIVTGKSTDEMARFAQQANKAAKSLSTSTTAYTDASLIYYQQGLSDKEVKTRTDTTVKLANVVGKEASEVSEWMTSIWNNFDDGSRSLENYADVLAKLGAATASSADEIAGGLEKFSAVANTVGLSYDYAASALATITAETRQSEDVVGTALKTIFARVENLKLGETLEDGTDLGQYSEALAKVGVNIKDSNGELRDMDTILNQMGAVWQTISKDQQIALAQSVAGIRQYNQFISLMDNWDVMEKNLELAKEANGELEIMNNIYGDGLEATTNRVKVELEGIKNALLDEDDLIPLLNVAEGFLGFVKDLIESLGGLPGLLSIIASIGLKIYGPQVAQSLRDITSNVRILGSAISGQAQQDRTNTIIKSSQAAAELAANSGTGAYGVQQSHILKEEAELTTELEKNSANISEENKKQLDMLRQILKTKEDIVLTTAKEQDAAEAEVDQARKELTYGGIEAKDMDTLDYALDATKNIEDFDEKSYRSRGKMLDHASAIYGTIQNNEFIDEDKKQKVGENLKDLRITEGQLTDTENELNETKSSLDLIDPEDTQQMEEATGKIEELTARVKKLKEELKEKKKIFADSAKQTGVLTKSVNGLSKKYPELSKDVKKYADNAMKSYSAEKKLKKENKELEKSTKNYRKSIVDAVKAGQDWATKTTQWAQRFATMASGFMMIQGSVENLTKGLLDGEATFSDYMSAIIGLVSGLGQLAKSYKDVSSVISPYLEKINESAAAKKRAKQATDEEAQSEKKNKEETEKSIQTDQQEVAMEGIDIATTKASAEAEEQGAKKEEKADKKKQRSNIMTALSGIVEQLGQGPSGWITGAISAALVLATGAALVGSMISGVSSASSSHDSEVKSEAASEATGNIEKRSEEVKENGDLVESYEKALITFRETGQEKEALANAATAVAEKYGLEGAAVAALTGDYEGLTKAVRNARIAELEGALEDNEKDSKAIAINAASKLEDLGASKSGGKIKVDINNGGASGDEGNIIRTVSKKGYKHITIDGDDLDIRYEQDSTQSLVEAYEEVQDLIASADYKDNSELAEDLQAFLKDTKESYEQAKKDVDFQTSAKKEKAYLSTTASSGKHVDEFQSMSEYESYRQRLKDSGEFKDEKELSSFLGSQSASGQFEGHRNILNSMAEKNKNVISKEQLQNLYDSLGTEYRDGLIAISEKEFSSTAELMAHLQESVADAYHKNSINILDSIGIEDEHEFDNYIERLKIWNKELQKNRLLTEQSARINASLQKGIKDLSAAWEENGDIIAKGQFNRVEYSHAITEIEKGLEGLLNLDPEKYDFSFLVENNMDNIRRILTGDEGAEGALAAIQAEAATIIAQQEGIVDATGKHIEGLIDEVKNFSYGQEKDFGTKFLFEGEDAAERTEKLEAAFKALGFAVKTSAIDGKEYISSIQKVTDATALGLDELKDKLDDIIDRYWLIDHMINDSNWILDILGMRQSRAYGNTAIGYMQKQFEELEKQTGYYQQKLEESKEWLKVDMADLDKIAKSYGVTLQLDDFGRVANQRAAVEQARNSGNEETAQKLKDAIDQYMETIDLQEELQVTLEENANEKFDNKLGQITESLDHRLALNEDTLAILEYQLGTIENIGYDAANSIAIINKQTALAVDNFEIAAQGVKDVLGATFSESEVEEILKGNEAVLNSKALTLDQIEAIKTYRDAVMENAEAIQEYQNTLREKVIEAFEHWNEEFDKNIARIEKHQNVIENYKNIIDLVGRDTLGITDEIMKELDEASVAAANTALDSAKKKMDANQQNLAIARDQLAKGQITQEDFDQIEEMANESASEFYDTWGTAMEAVGESFENAVSRTLDNFDKSVAGIYESLEQLEDAFNKQLERSDFFLKNYEKTYEISQLNRKIADSIEDTNSGKNKSALKKLQDELLSYQKEGKEMSDYDLGYLQKKYDLTQAQIALEEAQNNKTNVRLRRDSAGNYGYVYTANQEAIDQAEQKAEKARYELEKFLETSNNNLAKQLISLNKAYKSEIAALDKTSKNYEEEVKRITDHYQDMVAKTVGEMSDLVKYGKEANTEFGTNAAEIFEDTVIGSMYPQYKTFQELQEGINIALKTSLETIQTEYGDYQTKVESTMSKAGTSISDYKEQAVKDLNEVNKALNTITDTSEGLSGKFKTDFANVNAEVDSFYAVYKTKIGLINQETLSLTQAIDALLRKHATLPEGVETGGKNGELGGKGSGKINYDYSVSGALQPVGSEVAAFGSSAMESSGAFKDRGSIVDSSGKTHYYNSGTNVSYGYDEGLGAYNISFMDEEGNEVTGSLGVGDFKNRVTMNPETRYDSNNAYTVEDTLEANNKTYYKINGKWYDKGFMNVIAGKKVEKGSQVILTPNAKPHEWQYNGEFELKSNSNAAEIIYYMNPYKYNHTNNYFYEALQKLHSDATVTDAEGNENHNLTVTGVKNSPNMTVKGYKEEKKNGYRLYIIDLNGATYYINQTALNTLLGNKPGFQAYKAYNLPAFDTGGYTGAWGPEGRLAMLHQKEIVLNAHDTENFLSAIEIVRSISDQIEAAARLTTLGFGQIANINTTSHNPIEQNITIHAEFPNATDHNEIREALLSLSNNASQFITSNKS